MSASKNSVDGLCIQFYDGGEDKASYKHIMRLEAAGYKVSYIPTSGASAIMVNDYEVGGHTAIGNIVNQLLKS